MNAIEHLRDTQPCALDEDELCQAYKTKQNKEENKTRQLHKKCKKHQVTKLMSRRAGGCSGPQWKWFHG